MAFQSVPETAEIDHIFTLHGKLVQNVHYAKLPGGYNLGTLQALADAIDTVFAITFINDVCNDVSYLRTEVRGLEDENDLTAFQDAGAGVGTHAGESLPSNVTFALKKGSGLTGRSARGRTFWIGVPRNELVITDRNLLEALYITGMIANVEAVRNLINSTGSWEAVIVSRFSNSEKRALGVTFDWTGTVNVDDRVDTHRGRLPD